MDAKEAILLLYKAREHQRTEPVLSEMVKAGPSMCAALTRTQLVGPSCSTRPHGLTLVRRATPRRTSIRLYMFIFCGQPCAGHTTSSSRC